MQPLYGLIILAAILSALSIILVKEYIVTDDIKWMMFAIVLDILLMLLFVYIFKESNMVSSYPIVRILAIILVVLAGIIFYKQKLKSNYIVGIILGLIAIFIISQ